MDVFYVRLFVLLLGSGCILAQAGAQSQSTTTQGSTSPTTTTAPAASSSSHGGGVESQSTRRVTSPSTPSPPSSSSPPPSSTSPTHVEATSPTNSNLYQNCKVSGSGVEYMGQLDVTITGDTCQRWDSQSPQSHTNADLFPDLSLVDAANYCRNPGGTADGPWCYTTNLDVRWAWAYCDVPWCPLDCAVDRFGEEYMGTLSETSTGLTCQRWDAQSPHAHTRNDSSRFPDATLADAANYCRNPDYDINGGWCYTVNPNVRWQFCDIPRCQMDCIITDLGTEYAGNINMTEEGLTCQRWDSQEPHAHTYTNNNDFPDETVQDAGNGCRNPMDNQLNHADRPWCYTTDSNTRWQYCDVPMCHTYEVQLVGGSVSSEGIVNVRQGGDQADWGTVCNTGWGPTEADVVCKELGFAWGDVVDASDYDAQTDLISLDNVTCTGSETTIFECERGQWGITSCTHAQDAAVRCSTSEVRLVSDSSADVPHGTVTMVASEGRMLSVCSAGWDDVDAGVVCRELGYPAGGRTFPNLVVRSPRESVDGEANLFGCTGNETKLSDCSWLPTVNYNCGMDGYATLLCWSNTSDPANPPPVEVRVTGGARFWGRAEVRVWGVWGTITRSSADRWIAATICQASGFRSGRPLGLVRDLADLEESEPIFLPTDSCGSSGSGATSGPQRPRPGQSWMQDCFPTDFNSTTSTWANLAPGMINHQKDLHILCYDGQEPSWRLGDDAGQSMGDGTIANRTMGRIELEFEGQSGTVCNSNFGKAEAAVLCQSLGFHDGNFTMVWSEDSVLENLTTWFGNVMCSGDEEDLLDCVNDGFAVYDNLPQCQYPQDATVTCYNDVRLTGGYTPNTGRVEVKTSSSYGWRAVCGLGWDDVDANVTCHQLGFEYGIALCCATYGSSARLSTAKTDVTCSGSETSLLDCPTRGTYCPISFVNYASVYCHNGALPDVKGIYLSPVNTSLPFSNMTGLVRMVYQGIHGRVCGENWNDRNANVTCHELNFLGGVAFQHPTAGQGPMLLGSVNCFGNESRIEDCEHTPWLTDQCAYDAGVICYNQDLSVSKDDNGVVWVNWDDQRGIICSRTWSQTDADVACKQDGSVGGGVRVVPQSSVPSNTPVMMRDLDCTSIDSTLFECESSGWMDDYDQPCPSSNVAAVTCYGRVRLDRIQHTADWELGRVIAYSDAERWGTVCNTGFNNNSARIICSELGYDYSATLNPLHFESYYGFMTLKGGLRCASNATTLEDCQMIEDGTCYQSATNYTVVFCSKLPITQQMQGLSNLNLYRGSASTNGRIRLTRYGAEGKVCASYWDDKAANVTCRQLGYSGGVALHYRIYTRMTTWLLNLQCNGTEGSLSECPANTGELQRCPTTREAGALCYNSQGVSVSLSGGRTASEGRVDIRYDDVYGTVCDLSWSDNDAKVVCRQLGFSDGVAKRGSRYGEGGNQYISSVDCSGSEESLLMCPTEGWDQININYCGLGHTAGVVCYGDVRTTTGNSTGALQVYHDGRWGYVCDDGWDDRDAIVACQQLGYQNGYAACCSLFGSSYYYSFSANNVDCLGVETSFKDCPMTLGTYLSCPNRDYASVICFDEQLTGGNEVRLTYTIEDNAGVVLVKFADTEGIISADGWSDEDAQVVCRMLGYTGKGLGYPSTLIPGSKPFWLCNVTCTGDESTLETCPPARWGRIANCTTQLTAGVLCYDNTIDFRLVDGAANHGRLEIAVDGVWGTVCDHGFGDDDASVACKHFGYKSGVAMTGSYYGRGRGTVYLSGLQCTGEEDSILKCPTSGWYGETSSYWNSRCQNHYQDAGVYCYGSVRLEDGPNRQFGRVEAYDEADSQWYMVCDDGSFQRNEAKVACKQMGYPDGQSFCCSVLGEKTLTSKTLKNVVCSGNETSLQDCTHELGTCRQQGYVTLYCMNTTSNQTAGSMMVSLVNDAQPTNQLNGRLNVTRAGVSGAVCSKTWDDRAANVTCRSLGMAGGVAYVFSDRGSGLPFVLGNVSCTGLETSLDQCNQTALGDFTGCVEGEYKAGVLCYQTSPLEYRLSKGKSGLVEIYYDGEWGYICASGWTTNDARVLCRQLGYVDGSSYTTSGDDDIIEIWASSMYCTGTESSLLQCANSGWTNIPSYCRRALHFAAAQCHGNVVLSQSASASQYGSKGAVKIHDHSDWFYICDDGWDSKDVQVVCRELGYTNGVPACCDAFGSQQPDFLWTNVSCVGTETSIHDCPRATAATPYIDCQYASALCFNASLNGSIPDIWVDNEDVADYSGKVMVKYANVTGRICSDGWTDEDAKVVCKLRGYSNGESYHHQNSYYYSYLDESGPFWTSHVMCVGNETALTDCALQPWGTVTSCDSGHTAGVVCYENNGTYYRMADGGWNYGRVEVSYEGEWGTVCGDTDWDDKDARVFCRQMGFVDGDARYGSQFGGGTGKVYLSHLKCTGEESSLSECGHAGWEPYTSAMCTYHFADAGVYCYRPVRLYDGTRDPDTNMTAGAILYNVNHTWLAVCDVGFTDVTAREVCEELGFSDGRALPRSAYGNIVSYNYVTMNATLDCVGNETDIQACLRPVDCTDGYHASVICIPHGHNYNDSLYTFKLDNDATHGPVNVTYMNTPSRVCMNDWDDEDAKVLCNSLGKPHGLAYTQVHRVSDFSSYLYTSDERVYPFVLSDFDCTGNETDLMQCPYHDRHTESSNCSVDFMAGAVCFTDTPDIGYRLADGLAPNMGRVEISIDGVWGTVCDASWDNRDARVLCRQLNYTDGQALGDALFGQGNGTTWLTHVHCLGNETTLAKCPHTGWNTSSTEGPILSWEYDPDSSLFPSYPSFKYCSDHAYDAAVFCFGNVRLSEGVNSTFGAVQTFLEPTGWHLVCDAWWTRREAQIVCRELGFADGLPVPGSVLGDLNDTANGFVHARCPTGNERSLWDCLTNVTDANCTTGTYASVYCSNVTINASEPVVRLGRDEFAGTSYGIVEVRLDGVWGRVCNSGWGEREANVTCRSLNLNFTGGVPYLHVVLNDRPILMRNVTCRGDETSLMQCSYARWGDANECKNTAYEAGVLCYKTTGIQYRLGGSLNSSQGLVEISYDGQWGTVCDNRWGVPESKVLCRSLGFADGIVTDHVSGNGPVWLQNLGCEGDEPNLLQCRNSGWNSSSSSSDPYTYYQCQSHNRDATAQCFQAAMLLTQVRLVGSIHPWEGRVEVYLTQSENWGTICDDAFDDKDATVVCRMLNYTSGVAITNGRFGEGTGNIWMDDLGCEGDEENLSDCEHRGLGDHNCYHFEDVGVSCSGPINPATTTTAATTTTSSTTPTTTTSTTTSPTTTTPTTTSTTPTTTTPVTRKPTTPPTTTTPTTTTRRTTISSTLPGSTTTLEVQPTGQTSTSSNHNQVIIGILVPLIILCGVLLIVLGIFVYRRRAETKRQRASNVSFDMSDRTDSHHALPMDGYTDEPNSNRQFSNKLYDLVEDDPRRHGYQDLDASGGDFDNNNESSTDDAAGLTSNEFLPASEELGYTMNGGIDQDSSHA